MEVDWEFNLTVDPNYFGEYLDAQGIKRALEGMGKKVKLTEVPVTRNVKRPVYIEGRVLYNINFHTCYHTCPEALNNYLFFHEIHEIPSIGEYTHVPFGDFHRYTGVFTPAREFGEKVGINTLQMAADPYFYHKVEFDSIPNKYISDIIFVGNIHKQRMNDRTLVDHILPLVEKGYDVKVYGGGWDKLLPRKVARGLLPWEHAKFAYSGSKVGLNFVCGGMVNWGLGTNRLYQMGACGLPSVTYPCSDYKDSFEGVVEWATTPEEFVEKADALMGDDNRREKLGAEFHKNVISRHLWEHRMPNLHNILNFPHQVFRKYKPSPGRESWDVDILIVIPGDVKDRFGMGLLNAGTFGRPVVRFDTYLAPREFAIDKTRTDASEYFLSKSYRYLLFIDNDLRLPPLAFDRLIYDVVQFDCDIVCGWYNRIEPENRGLPHAYVRAENGELVQVGKFTGTNLVEVDRAPTGLMLIKRKVLEDFKGKNIIPFRDTRLFKEGEIDGHGLSEDMYFCYQAKKMGYKIYVDPQVFCHHLKDSVVQMDRIDIY